MQEDNTAIRRHVRRVTGVPLEVNLEYQQNYQAAREWVSKYTGDFSVQN